MTISAKFWDDYIAALRKISVTAAQKFAAILAQHPPVPGENPNLLIEAAYGLVAKYGEAAAELAAQLYDALGVASGLVLEPAIPAATATMSETARAVVGTLKTGNDSIVADAVGRLVKMAGVDTTMRNAIRDGAEWAWIPRGDTCAFCVALASRGWEPASRAQMKGNHAEHIHANCDCTFAVRFDGSSGVEGYNPDRYREMYDEAEGRSSVQKINSLRREFYAENRARIRAQQNSAYEKRIELNGSAAEETDIPG